MPGAGHIVHMPAHIYARIGRWADAITTNEHAVHADEAGLSDMAPTGVYRLGYYPHNFHFLWFAASMAGNRAQSVQAARDVAARVDTSLMTVPGLEAMQHYLMTPFLALVRFGMWDEILADTMPRSALPYPRGVRHYARALAFAARDDVRMAEIELDSLLLLSSDPAVSETMIWTSNSMGSVLRVATHVVLGEIALKKGDGTGAAAHMRQAVSAEDAMRFDEPPTWHLPARQNLGAILLANGDAAGAEAVYRADLARYPENGWSLFGLAASLEAQDRTDEAEAARTRFQAAWRSSDITLSASRF
jgi:tetratricopeptide (TPR) repeat protein